MPNYDFCCGACRRTFTRIVRVSERDIGVRSTCCNAASTRSKVYALAISVHAKAPPQAPPAPPKPWEAAAVRATGPNTHVFVYDSVMTDNPYGIVAKDGATVYSDNVYIGATSDFAEKMRRGGGFAGGAAQSAATTVIAPLIVEPPRRVPATFSKGCSVDGTAFVLLRPHEKKTSRNAPCPCGSGKRYKKCHGAVN